MILAFTAFALAVLAVLWLFQTVWLDDLYQILKKRDLTHCADAVAELCVTPNAASDEVRALAAKYGVCVSVYEVASTGWRGERQAIERLTEHVNPFCMIHNVRSDDLLNRLYRGALENGGSYSETVSLGAILGVDETDPDAGGHVIGARTLTVSGHELLLIFNTELGQMAATVKTLRLQLIVISAVILLVAVALAIFFSNRLSKPIRRMSAEASKLALGDYQVNFDGSGCRETENLSGTLNRAAYELSRIDRMQKDLIANVSHDLRTPLTMIAGYTEAMRDLPGEATAENMQIVIDETNRLSSLVNDMLEVSRYQGGEQVLKRSVFSFTKTVGTTLERYAKLREKDGYEIRFEADRNVWVSADEGRILQVIYNLINNAVNYTGDDKTVVIRQTVTNEPDGPWVLLEVIDTGVGIPAEELPLVWERYYKVHDFHKRANMGTGLGLSIVKNILLLHNAPFGVQSRVGEGSDFWFKLPVVPQPQIPEEASEE